MPLSWNEIKSRAITFAKQWDGETSERAESQSFWNDFFQVFGIERRRVAIFEKQVTLSRLGENRVGEKLKSGRIDAFWKGVLLIEHKSADEDLDRAFKQAADYFPGIAERDLPRYILVSDFVRFRLYDLERDDEFHFTLTELHKHIKRFGFIAGYQAQEIKPQDPVNIKAALQMGKLHDALKASGFTGHPLELLLVRILFCLFAEDTGIFQPAQAFRAWIEERTGEDGSDLGPKLAQFFQVLNTPEDKRSTTLDEQLNAFPYVNGRLFEETIVIADFDAKMRDTLLDCCALDWGSISPAIFGALFQSIMDDKARRNLGAHYTSEENILKLIKPLFLDDLWAEFNKTKNNKNKLFEFHKKLRTLTFFDPACGCGNFLVITYRELRLLELEVLRVVHEGEGGSRFLDIHQEIKLNVDQFYGIEIEEFPAQIAQVALWLADHQMNVRISEEFGNYFARIPLKTSAHIVHDNALKIDWANVLPPERCSYVMGNPPFVGAKFLDDTQRASVATVFQGIDSSGLLDFVAAWYVKAAHYLKSSSHLQTSAPSPLTGEGWDGGVWVSKTRCAFVSTNSITQGEQVGVLWGWLLAQGIKIHFAHRTFSWSNEAKGNAAVHCVIIGFGLNDIPNKIIYEYEDIRGEPHAVLAANINPYLIDGPDVIAQGRLSPICPVLPIANGSIPADGGNLIFTEAERNSLIQDEPQAAAYMRPYLGGEGFINNEVRYCLWLVDCAPTELRNMPIVRRHIKAVQEMRLASSKEATREKAATPMLFTENRQPTNGNYLAIPRTSSENRRYLPIGYLSSNIIAANDLQIVPNATRYDFGVLTSAMHKAWTNVTAGRLESRIRYSVKTTYNTFPWPDSPSDVQKAKIEEAAQAVLDVRTSFMSPSPQPSPAGGRGRNTVSSLADLYDPLTMPPALLKAHQKLDAAVDSAYGRKSFKNDAERVAFLFELYQKYTSILPLEVTKKKVRKARAR